MTNLPRPLVLTGGIALFAAVGFDTMAVIGRHIGLPLRGSIELVQAAVLVAGSVALLAATLARSHAGVHLLTERASPNTRSTMLCGGALAAAIFVAGLLAGSVWLATELWGGFEVSELLGIPYRLLRLIANVCLAATLAAFAFQALKPVKP